MVAAKMMASEQVVVEGASCGKTDRRPTFSVTFRDRQQIF